MLLFKGLSDPVELVHEGSTHAVATPPKPAITVLPFKRPVWHYALGGLLLLLLGLGIHSAIKKG